MKTIKREGKSEAAVVTAFMKEFGLKKGEFTYEVIDEGSKGFFSLFGSKPVIIRFTMKGEEDGLKSFLDGLLEQIGVEYQNLEIQRRARNVNINITGVNERGYLIGKEGRMLESIQHLAYRYLMKGEKEEINVRLDVDGYRRKHEKMLTDYLAVVVDKVKKSGRGITLDPLYTSDRKFVYRLLEKETAVKSVSMGDGQKKKIQIIPADAEIPAGAESEEDRSRGRRSRGGRGRGERRETTGEETASPRAPRERREPRTPREPRVSREPREASEPRPEGESPAETPQGERAPRDGARRPRSRRRPRPRREPRPEGNDNHEQNSSD
jgi:spoIIIJ-associated protein